jgi:thioredoxin 1
MASFKELIAADNFHATWCQPCKVLSPIVEQVKQRMGDRIQVLKIDVDRNQPLAQKLAIQGVPTLVIYRKGEQKWRQSGVLSAEAIIEQLEYFAN